MKKDFHMTTNIIDLAIYRKQRTRESTVSSSYDGELATAIQHLIQQLRTSALNSGMTK